MLNSFIKLREGKLDECKNEHIFPILRWLSGSRIDLHHAALVNRTFWWLPSDVAKAYIYLGLKDTSRFIKYPKIAKDKDDKGVELKKELIMKWLGWSEQELSRNQVALELINIEEVAVAMGCDNKERKVLGLPILKFDKIVKEKPKKKPKKTLLDF